MNLRDLAAVISPTFLAGGLAEKYLYSIAIQMDAEIERIQQGTYSKMPQMCDPSCLQAIGHDRSITRGLNESDVNYALRCKTAINDWHYAGLATGVLWEILGYLSPSTPLIQLVYSANYNGSNRTQWYWINALASLQTYPNMTDNINNSMPYYIDWEWDDINNRRRFWIIIHPGILSMPWIANGRTYADGSKYGDGHLYGLSGITQQQIKSLQSIIDVWKPAHAMCEYIIIALENTLNPFYIFDLPNANSQLPDGNWKNYGKVDGTSYVPARFDNCRFISGMDF
jgi:hypothetical protein